MEQLDNAIERLTETGMDAAGLHGVLAMMECVFTGDAPTESTMTDAFYWLCRQVKNMEKRIDKTCSELNDMKKELGAEICTTESRND